MQQESKGVELTFIPMLGKLFGVAMKAVTADNQTHFNLPGRPLNNPGLDNPESTAVFQQTIKNPNRITIHFCRNWQDNLLPYMAACRLKDRDRETGEIKDGESFGFSLQSNQKYPKGQNFLNLVYMSPDKAEGFEPLFIKIQIKDKKNNQQNISYLKISVEKIKDQFTVIAKKIPEPETPQHLQKLTFSKSNIEYNNKELARDLLGIK